MKANRAIFGITMLITACGTSQQSGNERADKLMGRWEGVWPSSDKRAPDVYRLIFRKDSTMDYLINGKQAFSGPFQTLGDTMMIWHGDSVYYDLLENRELWLRPPNKFNDTIWPIYEINFYR